MKTRFILTLLICLGSLLEANGAEPLKVSFRSRALPDATLSDYGKDDWQGYYRLEDFRLGFKAVMGRCELRSDISFAAGKVSIFVMPGFCQQPQVGCHAPSCYDPLVCRHGTFLLQRHQ